MKGIRRRVQEVVVDRFHRKRMNEQWYWDKRAEREGHARSGWHSQAFSEAWAARQAKLLGGLAAALPGGLAGRQVLDLGCGTGQFARLFARQGARVVGVDFSPPTLELARQGARKEGLQIRFEPANITEASLPFVTGSFDAAFTVSSLVFACGDAASLRAVLGEVRRVLRPGAPFLLLEPIHTSWLLGRVLRIPLSIWLACAQDAGFAVLGTERMGFVPARLALSSFDLPSWLVAPAFRAGEAVLDMLPRSAPWLADYAVLHLRSVPAVPSGATEGSPP